MLYRKPYLFLWLIVAVAAIFLFWKVNARGINEWDEARNGVNAYEMYHNGDFINLYYGGEPDTWNAKPPLMIWLITLGYHLFGFNAFALRLPSILAAIGILVYCWKMFSLSRNRIAAILTCLILLSCKAIIGIHLGLTGDFDALLLFFLTASAYYFFCYIELNSKQAIYWFGLFTGLAFYTKGTAALVYIPLFFIYASIRKGGFHWLRDYRVWASLLLIALIAGSWVALVYIHGKTVHNSHYGTQNSIETMLVHDTWGRLTSTKFDGGQEPDYLFFFEVLDTRFNVWNYFFYLSLVLHVLKFWKRDKEVLNKRSNEGSGLRLYSICIILPLGLLLTFAGSKHNWYLAPAFPFIAYIIADGLTWLTAKWNGVYLGVGALFLVLLVRQGIDIDSETTKLGSRLGRQNPFFNSSNEIVTVGYINQDIFLYLKWLNKKIVAIEPSGISSHKNAILVTNSLSYINNSVVRDVWYDDRYYFGRVK